MEKQIKNYLKFSISLLITSALLLALPSLIFEECMSVFGGGCKPSMSRSIISLFSYICGIVLGVSGAIFLRKHNDLIDENKKAIKENKELSINEKRNEIQKIINDKN